MANRNFHTNKFTKRPAPSSFNNGFTTKYFSEDPLFIHFSIFFDLSSPLFNLPTSTLGESAERYFLNLDDNLRASYVADLRERIVGLTTDHQYFLKTITGLNTLYSKTIGEEELELELEVVESLDMRMTKIKELFSKISYDYDNERELLPKNLQWMDIKVLVHDGRSIGKWVNGEVLDVTPSLDTLVYTIKKCRFNTEEGHSYLDTIQNDDPQMSTNTFKIIGGHSSMKESRVALATTLSNEIDNITNNRTTVKVTNTDVEQLKVLERTKIKSKNETTAIENKESLKDILKRAGGGNAGGSIKRAGQRMVRDEIIDQLIQKAVQPSSLGNIQFRGGAADFANSGDVVGLLNSAINNNLLPDLSSNIANIILNGGSLDQLEADQLYKEILKLITPEADFG